MDRLLEPGGIDCVFQPAFTLGVSRRIHMVEALSRGPVGTNVHSAGVLFEYVRRKGKEPSIDRVCAAAALAHAAALECAPLLSLNVHAATLERDPGFAAHLASAASLHGFALDRLVLEIVEHAPSWGGPSFRRVLDALRADGVGVALDDIGLGQSTYRMILECRPDYFKVDAFLIRGCHDDEGRRAILDSLLGLACRLGARVVAEGVEDERDLACLEALGMHLAQGFLLSPPLPAAGLAGLPTRAGRLAGEGCVLPHRRATS